MRPMTKRSFLSIAFLLVTLAIIVWAAPAAGQQVGVPNAAIPFTVPPNITAQYLVNNASAFDFTGFSRPMYFGLFLPARPLRVGVQAGHYLHELAPPELAALHGATGAISGPYTEESAVLAIAEDVRTLLERQGITVDLLPATVPPGYRADAFIAIHADGSPSSAPSGFKVAAARRDLSGLAPELAAALDSAYGNTTGLRQDPHITLNMTGYYAFNYKLYRHSVDPFTPSALIETGFITNPQDRTVIVQHPALAARGIAEGILLFLSET